MADDTLKISTGITLKPQSTQPEGDAGTLYIDSTTNELRVKTAAGLGAPETNVSGDIAQLQSDVILLETGYSRRSAVKGILDCTLAPPAAVSGDRYILDFTAGTLNAGYGAVSKGDIVQYNGATWDATTPQVGYVAFVDDGNELDALYHEDGGATWETRAAGGAADASSVSFTPTGETTSTNVQAAIVEVQNDATGSVTAHSDVTSAGSGAIITTLERANLNNALLKTGTNAMTGALSLGGNTIDETALIEANAASDLRVNVPAGQGFIVSVDDTFKMVLDASGPDFQGTRVKGLAAATASTDAVRKAEFDLNISAGGSIASHSDVDLTGLADGHILKYNLTNSRFEPVAESTGGSGTPTIDADLDMKNFFLVDSVDGIGAVKFKTTGDSHNARIVSLEDTGEQIAVFGMSPDEGSTSEVFILGSEAETDGFNGGNVGIYGGSVLADVTSPQVGGAVFISAGGDDADIQNGTVSGGSVTISAGTPAGPGAEGKVEFQSNTVDFGNRIDGQQLIRMEINNAAVDTFIAIPKPDLAGRDFNIGTGLTSGIGDFASGNVHITTGDASSTITGANSGSIIFEPGAAAGAGENGTIQHKGVATFYDPSNGDLVGLITGEFAGTEFVVSTAEVGVKLILATEDSAAASDDILLKTGNSANDNDSGNIIIQSGSLTGGNADQGLLHIDTGGIVRGANLVDVMEDVYIHSTTVATSPTVVFDFVTSTVSSVIIDYTLSSVTGVRTGTLRVANDNGTYSINDVNVETAAMGVTFSVADNLGDSEITATNTSGQAHTMRMHARTLRA